MALLDANEILQLNDKINTFVLVKPNQIDDLDVDLFVVKPPPSELDPAHRAPVQIASPLCDACRSALEYFSFFNTLKSRDVDAAEKIPSACLLHTGAKTLQDGDHAGCHLCILLMANLRVKRLAMRSIDQSNIEMCWQSDSSKPGARQLHFALTHRGHPRSSSNYWNLLKLRLWPASEFNTSLLGEGEAEIISERHSNTRSEQSREMALAWLARCQANRDGIHDQCNRSGADVGEDPGWLPTRLLDVSLSVETSTVKLVMPASSPGAFASDMQYLTLSHCWGAWGGAELPVLTTKNLDERLTKGLPVSLLPQTFQDAVEVARWFKVRWLWIDSLCIIQDSDDDWRREAVMMYDVYKNALLNISANDSPDARWGCFRERHPLAVMPMQLGFPDGPNNNNNNNNNNNKNFILIPDTNAIFDSVNEAPLAKRGWVFQERQLSRRVLHFTSSELIWECCAKAPYGATETFPGGIPFKTAFSGKPKFQTQTDLADTDPVNRPKLYATWDILCKEYSAKVFSYARDRLVALSGLAQQFEKLAFPDDTYVAGMWQSTIPGSLLWETSSSSTRLQAPDYIAPSWSWVSIGGPISTSELRSSEHSLVEVLSVMVDPVIPSKPTAMLKGASIRLRCFLRPVEIRPDYEKKPWYMLAMGGGKKHKLLIKSEGSDDETASPQVIDNFHSDAFRYSFDDFETDDETQGPEAVSGYFLPLVLSQADEASSSSLHGLLIERVSGDDGEETYRRVGVLRVFGLHCLRVKYGLRNRGVAEIESTWGDVQKILGSMYVSVRDQKKYVENGDDGSVGADDTEEIGEDGKGKMEPRVGVDLGGVDALERLYYLDKEALEGSGFEAAVERLALREISLI